MSTSHHSTSLLRTVVRWSRVRGANVGSLHAPASGSSWPTSLSDGEAAIAFLRILLGCFVGMHTPHHFNIMEHFSDVIFFFWGNAETASFHGGITLASFLVLTSLDRVARWRKRAISPPSSIRQQLRQVYSYPSFVCVVVSDWGSPCKKINK